MKLRRPHHGTGIHIPGKYMSKDVYSLSSATAGCQGASVGSARAICLRAKAESSQINTFNAILLSDIP